MQKLGYLTLLLVVFISCKSLEYRKLEEGVYAELVTNKGPILIELYTEKVPMTTANFVSLIEGTNSQLLAPQKGINFYEGVIFHRVISNFVIQAGGFTSKERKKLSYVFGDEFPKDKEGDLLYKHNDSGILSMANAGPTTNNSQFFITHRATSHLDGRHTVFGKTIINSIQLKELKSKINDSLLLKKAIDSTRMRVVNSIVQKDTILSVKIIKVGSKAKKFNAAKVFDTQLEMLENSKITSKKTGN
ncbi:MAG: putative peptidyl-prolyl cis-trans isomerase [Polaribacter sejongensis]|nr:MAG: putative peptidyl-prolyl cis-trans isomerase [Polaribacter sejongensis]|tara:strand:+ start:1911 stop:2648 length:738 start_codon:yes stop_codon:yes gene_type:complete